jgi:hypothetical protein
MRKTFITTDVPTKYLETEANTYFNQLVKLEPGKALKATYSTKHEADNARVSTTAGWRYHRAQGHTTLHVKTAIIPENNEFALYMWTIEKSRGD